MKAATIFNYLVWAASRLPSASRTCPGCESDNTRLIKRKHVVTCLYGCDCCGLMFRVPKGSVGDGEQFYEAEYAQESTTELPDDDRLEALKKGSFDAIGKDYRGYIAILRALGIDAPASIYDFGCSWGYGSWQFRQHGYTVLSYEVAKTRARFADERLGCYCLESPRPVPQQVDCFFASNVLEHLPNPNLLWEVANDALKPSGVIVLSMPNGEPSREQAVGRSYHQLWGLVHPLLLTARALEHMAERHHFTGVAYTSPYDLLAIEHGEPGSVTGEQLLFVARKASC